MGMVSTVFILLIIHVMSICVMKVIIADFNTSEVTTGLYDIGMSDSVNSFKYVHPFSPNVKSLFFSLSPVC